MKELFISIIIIMLVILGIGSCDYQLTKSALTELSDKEPKPSTVIWVMSKGNYKMVRVEK